MKKKILVILVVLALIGGFIYWRNSQRQKETKQAQAYIGTLRDTLIISGEINATNKVTAQFQSTGKLASVSVKEGEYIKKYQHIASLDQRQLQNSLEQQLNTYMDARWDLEQMKNDNQKTAELGSDAVVRERAKRLIDQSQFALNKAVLAVEAQALAKEFAHIYSPLNGIVTRVESPLPGVYITAPTQAEFDIVDPTSIYFEALADQTEVASLYVDQPTEIVLDAFPESTISGNIQSISFTPKTNEVGTVYPILISLPVDNSTNAYKIGMTGDVTFIKQIKENVLILPVQFIQSKDGKEFVYAMENGKKIEKEIETGLETDDEIEITKGLNEGDVVYD